MPPKWQPLMMHDVAVAQIAPSEGATALASEIAHGVGGSGSPIEAGSEWSAVAARASVPTAATPLAGLGSRRYRIINLDCFITRSCENPENATFRDYPGPTYH
jgi:hypothetical protein